MNDDEYKTGRQMPLNPHRDKLIETVVITHPDFACWVLDSMGGEGWRWLRDYIQMLIQRFDEKPFTHHGCAGKLDGQPCTRPVTQLSFYRNNASPMFWCDECDPHSQGATPGMITVVSATYREALQQACVESGTREAQRSLVAAMAEAKGLTGNKTEAKILRFFY